MHSEYLLKRRRIRVLVRCNELRRFLEIVQ
jgi:hypothetical protein